MKVTKTLAVLVASGLLLFAAACGGDDDDSSSPSSTGTSGGGDAAPTATTEAAADPTSSSGGGATSSGADTVGSVTIGDETWMIVASGQCSFMEEQGGVPGNTFSVTVISIAGHAEADESIEIAIDFDPRDTGLVLTVKGGGGDPDWAADNASFTVGAGATSISGDGTFDSLSSPGTSEAGSFEARCS